MATKTVTVALPEELLDEIHTEATDRNLSEYVTEALRRKLDQDRQREKVDRDGLRELVDWLEDEYGPVTEQERAEARAELAELDAEHERRRKRSDNAGEPA